MKQIALMVALATVAALNCGSAALPHNGTSHHATQRHMIETPFTCEDDGDASVSAGFVNAFGRLPLQLISRDSNENSEYAGAILDGIKGLHPAFSVDVRGTTDGDFGPNLTIEALDSNNNLIFFKAPFFVFGFVKNLPNGFVRLSLDFGNDFQLLRAFINAVASSPGKTLVDNVTVDGIPMIKNTHHTVSNCPLPPTKQAPAAADGSVH